MGGRRHGGCQRANVQHMCSGGRKLTPRQPLALLLRSRLNGCGASRWLDAQPTIFNVVIMLFILYRIMKELWVTLHLYNYEDLCLLWAKQGKSIFEGDIKPQLQMIHTADLPMLVYEPQILRPVSCPLFSSVDSSGPLVA